MTNTQGTHRRLLAAIFGIVLVGALAAGSAAHADSPIDHDVEVACQGDLTTVTVDLLDWPDDAPPVTATFRIVYEHGDQTIGTATSDEATFYPGESKAIVVTPPLGVMQEWGEWFALDPASATCRVDQINDEPQAAPTTVVTQPTTPVQSTGTYGGGGTTTNNSTGAITVDDYFSTSGSYSNIHNPNGPDIYSHCDADFHCTSTVVWDD